MYSMWGHLFLGGTLLGQLLLRPRAHGGGLLKLAHRLVLQGGLGGGFGGLVGLVRWGSGLVRWG